ncbi:MAG: Ig-like domain-containing protein [Anaerolineales bacterium]|nr:Ig-like domain-containing protein [Anaerolineales bacterium]
MLFRRRTFPRWLILIPILLLILLAGGLPLARGRPTVTEIFPAPDTLAVPGLAPIHLTFSRAMNHAAVEQNLTLTPAHPGSYTWEGNILTFTPTEPWPGGATITAALGTGARSSLGMPLTETQTWSFTIARTMLAYLWPANGSANLYMLDPVGGTVVQLTETGGVLEFSVGEKGLALYFSAMNEAGGSSLWRLDMLTRTKVEILTCVQDLCALPQLSPDGKWLAYENTSRGDIWLLPLDGGEPVRLAFGTRPQWSSDGSLAFYDGEKQAFQIMDPTGTILASLPNTLGEPGAWTINGDFFTVPTSDIEADTSRLFAFLPLNGLLNDLSGPEPVEDTSPAYSPDGRWLAFARKYLDANRWTPGRQLWLMSPDGSNAHPLTNDEFYSHASFAWNPDSQIIAFVKAHRTAPEVPPALWMINVDGSNPLQLVIEGYAPQWVP